MREKTLAELFYEQALLLAAAYIQKGLPVDVAASGLYFLSIDLKDYTAETLAMAERTAAATEPLQ
jgi:hypothetical protein